MNIRCLVTVNVTLYYLLDGVHILYALILKIKCYNYSKDAFH